MGGALALDAAAAHPDRVAGLVLFAPGVPGAPFEPEMTAEEQVLAERIDAAWSAGDLPKCHHLEIRYWLDGPAAPEGRVAGPARDLALAMNAVILARGDPDHDGSGAGESVGGRLPFVRMASTVACGEFDEASLLDLSSQLAGRLPHGRQVLRKGRAHLPYLEDPGESANLILEALSG